MREGCVRQARVVSHRESDLQSAAHFDQNVTVNTVGFAGGIKKVFGCKGALTLLNGQSGARPASFSTSGWCRVLSLDMRGWFLSGDSRYAFVRVLDIRSDDLLRLLESQMIRPVGGFVRQHPTGWNFCLRKTLWHPGALSPMPS